MQSTVAEIECQSCWGTAEEVPGSSARYVCRDCGTETTLHVTQHAGNNWRERAYSDSVDIAELEETVKEAWTDGRTVLADYRDWDSERGTLPPAELTGHRFYADEVRYYRVEKLALVRQNTSIVTVIDLPTARTNAQWSVVQTYIAGRGDTSTIYDVMTECNVRESAMSTVIDRERQRRRIAKATLADDGPEGAVSLDSRGLPESWPEAHISDPTKISV